MLDSHIFIIIFCLLGNAAGKQTPPLLIFSGKRLPNQIQHILPNDWHVDISDSGWMTSDIFFKYISKVFYPWLEKSGITTPIILFVDGHVNHRSLQLSEFCSEKKIVLVSFIPNATHICQPMDVVVFSPLKKKWSECLQIFRAQNQQMERMSKQTFCDLLSKCIKEVCTQIILKIAFEKTGLFPFSEDNFNYSQLSEKTNETSNTCGEDPIFLEFLEGIIKSNFPNHLEEFKATAGDWSGMPTAKDLFEVWRASGGVRNELGDNAGFHSESEGIQHSDGVVHGAYQEIDENMR